MRPLVLIALVVLALLSGCAATRASNDASVGAAPPPVTGRFDYQLGAAYDGDGFDVVVRDSTAEPLDGAYNVCYINGFQTQPGEAALWLDGHQHLLLHEGSGELAVDPDWPGEYILDPSSATNRAEILEMQRPAFERCADAGFDAIELDNLDAWTRFTEPSAGELTEEDALALAVDYVAAAHGVDLAIAQKNAPQMSGTARDTVGFDFVIAEECAAYDESSAYSDVYGERMLQIEYVDNLPRSFEEVCASTDRAPLTILRDRDLVGPDHPDYVYEQCDG